MNPSHNHISEYLKYRNAIILKQFKRKYYSPETFSIPFPTLALDQ